MEVGTTLGDGKKILYAIALQDINAVINGIVGGLRIIFINPIKLIVWHKTLYSALLSMVQKPWWGSRTKCIEYRYSSLYR